MSVKKTDIGVGLYILAAIIFFIVPIPSILLDVMLAINISISLIILFTFKRVILIKIYVYIEWTIEVFQHCMLRIFL